MGPGEYDYVNSVLNSGKDDYVMIIIGPRLVNAGGQTNLYTPPIPSGGTRPNMGQRMVTRCSRTGWASKITSGKDGVNKACYLGVKQPWRMGSQWKVDRLSDSTS